MSLTRRRWFVAMALASACTSSGPEATRDRATAPVEPPDDRSICAAMCEHLATCALPDFRGTEPCTSDCTNDARQRSGPCRAPRIAYERCAATASCDELRAAAGADPRSGPCGAEAAAIFACEPESPPQPFIYFQF